MISGANPPRDIGVVRLCAPLRSFGRVFSGAGRYMRAAEKHLDSVCKGQFPEKIAGCIFRREVSSIPLPVSENETICLEDTLLNL